MCRQTLKHPGSLVGNNDAALYADTSIACLYHCIETVDRSVLTPMWLALLHGILCCGLKKASSSNQSNVTSFSKSTDCTECESLAHKA